MDSHRTRSTASIAHQVIICTRLNCPMNSLARECQQLGCVLPWSLLRCSYREECHMLRFEHGCPKSHPPSLFLTCSSVTKPCRLPCHPCEMHPLGNASQCWGSRVFTWGSFCPIAEPIGSGTPTHCGITGLGKGDVVSVAVPLNILPWPFSVSVVHRAPSASASGFRTVSTDGC